MDATNRLENKYPLRCLIQQGLLGKVVYFGCPYLYFCHFGGEGLWGAGFAKEV